MISIAFNPELDLVLERVGRRRAGWSGRPGPNPSS